jgi:hypothetical protein
VWMLLPDSADVKIVERAHLSRDALLSLASLLITTPNVPHLADGVHDTLSPPRVDGCKGGHRAAPTTDGSDDLRRAGSRADRHHDTKRTYRSDGPHTGGGVSSDRKEC